MKEVDGGFAYFDGENQVSEVYKAKIRLQSKRLAEVRYKKELQESGDYEIDYTSPKQSVLRDELSTARDINEGVDMSKLRDDIRKKMSQKAIKAGYKKWLNDTYSNLVESKRIFKG